jgi:hypothetical protein
MQTNSLLEQIDWFFTSINQTNSFPNTMVKPLGKPVSDHTPCVISIQTTIPHSKIFRFETYWIQHPGFTDVVSYPEKNFSKILKHHLLRLLNYQREYWRKRCTIHWIRFEDEDPKNFQAMALERYRKNNIHSLTILDGTQVDDHGGKEEIIYQAFKIILANWMDTK